MNQRRFARLTAALLLPALLLAGCGANPAATKKSKSKQPARSALQAPLMGPGAPMAGPPGAASPEVAFMLNAMRQLQQTCPGFTATVETYDKGPSGTESTTMKVAYKKPHTLRIEMLKAKGQAQGAKILWTGGSDLTIKPTFVPFSVTKSVSDEMVKSKNGWTLHDTEVTAIFKVLFDPGAQITAKGIQPVEGRQLAVFEVRSPASPKGATHEAICIDPQTGLPACRMLFNNQTLIYRLTLKNMTVKSPSSSELEV